jgi:hypothetical protein
MFGVFQSHPSGRLGMASSADFVVRQALQVLLAAAPEVVEVGDCETVVALLSLPPLTIIAAPTIAAPRSIAAVTIASGNHRRGRSGALIGAHGGGAEGSGGRLGLVIYPAADRAGCRSTGFSSVANLRHHDELHFRQLIEVPVQCGTGSEEGVCDMRRMVSLIENVCIHRRFARRRIMESPKPAMA